MTEEERDGFTLTLHYGGKPGEVVPDTKTDYALLFNRERGLVRLLRRDANRTGCTRITWEGPVDELKDLCVRAEELLKQPGYSRFDRPLWCQSSWLNLDDRSSLDHAMFGIAETDPVRVDYVFEFPTNFILDMFDRITATAQV